MSLDRAVMLFAGCMVLLSVVLTVFVSPLFVWFTVFIGLNLIQSAFTGYCPAARVFRAMGVKAGVAFYQPGMGRSRRGARRPGLTVARRTLPVVPGGEDDDPRACGPTAGPVCESGWPFGGMGAPGLIAQSASGRAGWPRSDNPGLQIAAQERIALRRGQDVGMMSPGDGTLCVLETEHV
jgi:hypothetical protein